MCEISIIIPIYNMKTYIEDTARSVLDQTFEDLELLLIDDGSSDGSDLICDGLASSDARVKVFHTENRGVSAARNLGLKNASGRYIGFIDADDHVDRTYLEKLHAAIETGDAGMAVSGYYEIRNGKKSVHTYPDTGSGDKLYDLVRQDTLCILWNKLFVRDKIKHLFEEGLSTCEDSLFCIRYYLDNVPETVFVKEPLYGYVAQSDGLSSTYHEGAFAGINKLLLLNRKLSKMIGNDELRQSALHHAYKVYFYGVYTYIFGNLSNGKLCREKLPVFDEVLNDKRYQRIIRYIASPKRNKNAEKNSAEESLIIFFSVFKMKRAIILLSKVKKCLAPLRNR
ncbi:MAG: glycosyltransferase family 2 protein [Lachnospiraceae bacterium]|nr:glycosyltransferase family 2 protein [Lachnospiraceae bacterium]